MNVQKHRYELKLNDFENHIVEVLKDCYKIKPSEFTRQALVEKCQRDLPEIRKRYLVKIGQECPF